MKKLALPSATAIRLLSAAYVVLLTSCFHKPDQYDPLVHGAPPIAGFGPDGGGGREVGTGATGDGPAPTSQVCGTTCEAEKSDGCCPVGCSGASDVDCTAQCGNGVVERGEECDPPSSCPASCPNRGCTKFALKGAAAMCTAICEEAGKETTCKIDDGCCPAGCSGNDDNDCLIMCGNGTKEGNETCDPLSTCPTTCAPEACQLRKLVNEGSCTAECVNDRLQTTCMAGDGCCPAGCHTGNDADCMATCDNGIKESGETCDPLSSCPTACPANECQLRRLTNEGTCKALCVNDRLQTACAAGDECCPPGCNTANDSDCGVRCGDGVRDMTETCDPLSTCPTTCPAMGCQLRKLNNGGTCKAACANDRLQTACMSGDDCCPPACNANNDSDCDPRCGNGVVEGTEKCEPVAECTRRQEACRSDRDTVRSGQGNPSQCSFECSESARRCGDADGQCPGGCQNDPDCKKSNGSVCVTGSECLSGRCDGHCCAAACSACQKCTGAGGTCQLPANTRVCGDRCISTSQCCQTCGNECSPCDAASGECRAASGRSCNGGNGTCNSGGTCIANCQPNQVCGTNNDCTTGRTRCNPSGCTQTDRTDGTNCGSNGICNDGACRQCTGNTPCRLNGACRECCNDSHCDGDDVCRNNECGPPPCGAPNQECCANSTCPRQDLVCIGNDGIPPDDGDNRFCRDCGGNNEFCCGRERRFVNALGARCNSGFVCPQAESSDLCTPCGDANEPCCVVSGEFRCNGNLTCMSPIFGRQQEPGNEFNYDLPGFCQ